MNCKFLLSSLLLIHTIKDTAMLVECDTPTEYASEKKSRSCMNSVNQFFSNMSTVIIQALSMYGMTRDTTIYHPAVAYYGTTTSPQSSGRTGKQESNK